MPRRVALPVVLRAAAAIVVASLLIPAVPDVDLWGHTLFGADIVRSGTLAARDHYSFTSDITWMNHEWLGEVLMYGAWAVRGGAGLSALRLMLVGAMLGIVWASLRGQRVAAEPAFALVTMLALLTYARTQHVRPQLFSLVAFAALLAVLTAYERTRRLAWLLAVPVIVIPWANAHGGIIVGMLPLGLWAAAVAISDLPWRSRAIAIGVLTTGVLATLVNPYGFGLWQFLARTVRLNRADITEWWPVTSMGPGFVTLWAATALIAMAGVAWHARPLPLHRVALVAALGFASFRVNRLDAFFAISVVICFGPPLAAFWSERRRAAARRLAPAAAVAILAVSIASAGAVLLRAAPSRDGCVDDASWLPDQAASAFVAENQLRGRMLVFFNWGEYVLWHFGSTIKVSIDGRRETIYSDRHITGHLEAYRGTPAGLAYVRELSPDYVWLPKAAPGAARLQSEGWKTIFAGDRSIVLARDGASPDNRAWTMPASGCFPGRLGKPSPLASGFWKDV